MNLERLNVSKKVQFGSNVWNKRILVLVKFLDLTETNKS